jgi:formylglycine-generating enzyme required for sulfatase activity
VRWYDAVCFCNELSSKEGLEPCYPADIENLAGEWDPPPGHFTATGYRLPTEEEWELAARAGSVTDRYFGDGIRLMDEYCWTEHNSYEPAKDAAWRARPCGLLKPNEFGLFDVYGNVQEWCVDKAAAQPTHRLLCGGSYKSYQLLKVSSTLRGNASPEDEWEIIGFRIVRTVPESQVP